MAHCDVLFVSKICLKTSVIEGWYCCSFFMLAIYKKNISHFFESAVCQLVALCLFTIVHILMVIIITACSLSFKQISLTFYCHIASLTTLSS